jgi:hypothetical protein
MFIIKLNFKYSSFEKYNFINKKMLSAHVGRRRMVYGSARTIMGWMSSVKFTARLMACNAASPRVGMFLNEPLLIKWAIHPSFGSPPSEKKELEASRS